MEGSNFDNLSLFPVFVEQDITVAVEEGNSKYSFPTTLTTSCVLGGSKPFLAQLERWPTCNACTAPLVSFIQINALHSSTPNRFAQALELMPSLNPLITPVFLCRNDDDNCLNVHVNSVMAEISRSVLTRVLHFDAGEEEPRIPILTTLAGRVIIRKEWNRRWSSLFMLSLPYRRTNKINLLLSSGKLVTTDSWPNIDFFPRKS